MGDQPGAGGSHSYKIRGHSRQRRSTKPYSRPSDGKKGVLETVKEFFSPSWLVDFWKGKITPEEEEEEEVEQDEDVEEPEYPTDMIQIERGSSRRSSELVNTRLTGQTSSDTRLRSDKVYGNGGVRSASAQITSQTSRKSGLTAFLASSSRHKSDKKSVVTRTTGSSSRNTGSWRPVDQERLAESSASASDHIDPAEGESPSSSQIVPSRTVSNTKDSESPFASFLNPGPSRKPLPSLIETSTPMPGPSTTTPMAQLSTASERIQPSTGSRPQPTSVFRSRPEFSVAAFGSPLPQNTQNKRFSSPFYSGKTTFGGASSQFAKSTKRMRISSPGSLEASRPVKKQIKPTPITGPGVGGVASQTAKRILETLEKMSTPLVDAKKIPPSPPFSASSSPLSFTQSTRRKHPYQPNRVVGSPRKLQAQFGVPPVQSLSVPQRASISRIHQKTQSTRTSTITSQSQETTSTARNISSREISKPTTTFMPTPLPISLSPKESASKAGGKIRTAKSSNAHYKSQNTTEEEEEEEVVNPLPEIVSAVPLNIPSSASLPTFSFSPSSTSKTSTSMPSTSKMGFSFAPPKSKQADITSNNFKFSIPEPKASSSITLTSNQTPEKKSLYSFSQPAPVNKSDSSEMSDDVKNTTTKSSLDKYKPAKGSWECATCMVNNKATAATCVACSASKPAKTVPLSSNDLFKKFATPAGSWNCGTCLIQNKSNDDKCVACETPKPSSSKSTSTPVVLQSDDLKKNFAPAEDSWECSACMINNNGRNNNCAACQTPKPSSSKSISSPVVLQSDDLRKKLAPADNSWECSTCMINNKSSDNNCVACQTPKPSLSQKSSLPTTVTPDNLMKKFAPTNDSWECSTCMINNKSSDNKCAACQTPKPGAESSSSTSSSKFTFGAGTLASKFAPASGSWTCDTCMIVNKSDALKCLACETAKPGSSSFGGASTGSNTETAFQFGTSSSKSDSSSSSVPLKFGSNAVTMTTPPFAFGVSSESKKSESSNVSSFVFGKSIASTSDTKTSDSSSTAPSFTFGAGPSSTATSKPTFQFGITADSKVSDSPKKALPTIESVSNATSVDSQPKVQFGAPVKTDDQKASPFIFGGSKPAVQFGNGSLVQGNTPKTSELPPKRKHSSIADAAAAGLLKIPSSSPAPVVDLTGEDSNTDPGSAPPNVNLFQSGTQTNQMFSTAAATVTTKSETTGSTTLPSLPFAFGATPTSKPADEPPKAVPPFSFMAGASNTVAVSTAAAPTATASPFNFASSLGSSNSNKGLSTPTTSSIVMSQFGSFGAPPVSTTVAGFPSVLNAATTSAETSTPFAFKATTNTNGKFGAPTAPTAPSGFAFGTPLSDSASGSTSAPGGFAFGVASAAPSATNATSAPFVFGGQNTSEPKASFNFTAPSQPFAFGGSAIATQNTQGSTSQQVPEESMDADGNNNSSQATVPAFGSQPPASAPAFNFNTAPSTNTGFSFGSTQPSSTFKFGANQAPSLGGNTPGVGTPVPAFGAPAPTPAASGGFNFGSPATNNIGSAQPAGFMAGPGGGGFSAGTGGTQTKRIIKKGVRRMKR